MFLEEEEEEEEGYEYVSDPERMKCVVCVLWE